MQNLNKSLGKTHLINGPAGNLELRWQLADNNNGLVAVICHPHSLYGGSMDNKVVTTLAKAYAQQGYSTVVFNFRGVAHSQGNYDQGQGEQEDLKAVVNWVKQQLAVQHLTLAGFSFGSFVALSAYKACQADALTLVAPPVGLYDFSGFNVIDVPWTLIQGGRDEVVNPAEVFGWAGQQAHLADLYWRAPASHFFHGELIWLREVVKLAANTFK